MHLLVLEDREHGFASVEQRMAGPIEVGVRQRIDDEAIGFVGKRPHDVA